MDKEKIKPGTYLYPMPSVVVGTKNEEGNPNFLTIAYSGIAESKPPTIMISSAKSHYSNKALNKNREFSANIPTKTNVKKVDFVGLKSGKNVDKSEVFDVFYGELKNAPLIKEIPLNMECKVSKKVDLGGTHEIFFGEIINAYATKDILKDGKPFIEKLKPLMYSNSFYWKLGGRVAKAFKVGDKIN
jgi:flavin reductase (DIM6/NTAB) family NADH-FMN oxidoreductase RutF